VSANAFSIFGLEHITDRDRLRIGLFQKIGEIQSTHAATADQAHANAVVGGNLSQKGQSRETSQSSRAGALLKKLSSVHFSFSSPV
jgi:hypothetical protein